MKTLWYISWSKYSWWELWTIFKGYITIIGDIEMPEPFNSNLLHIGAKTGNIKLFNKILLVENITDIKERDGCGKTVLDIARCLHYTEMTAFLEKAMYDTIGNNTQHID
ncbi:MAG: hypothetical protein RLZZ81_817 [Pseudomonadota bacterium]|jgi:hypothetical protein